MNVLLINASPQQAQSSTYGVAQKMIEQWSKKNVIELQQVDATSLPHIDSEYANALCLLDAAVDETAGSLAISNELIASLEWASVVIIVSPMHNYSLPSCLKSWVDHVVRAGKTFEITSTGKHALLDDKPVYILVSSGGVFSGEGAYQPDFFTPYMKEVLSTMVLIVI
jgi:FMN-dependent NADH-azoreductase